MVGRNPGVDEKLSMFVVLDFGMLFQEILENLLPLFRPFTRLVLAFIGSDLQRRFVTAATGRHEDDSGQEIEAPQICEQLRGWNLWHAEFHGLYELAVEDWGIFVRS